MSNLIVLLDVLMQEFAEELVTLQQDTHRSQVFPDLPQKIDVVIGMRRCGKTHFVYQYAKGLLAEGVPLTHVLYIDFEDDRLLPMSAKELAQLIDAFYAHYPDNHDELCYLLFDEIQNVEAWPLLMRRLSDSKKVKIVLTGSSSKLLSKEIATSLRGRSIATEIWPFDFNEYLTALGQDRAAMKGQKGIDQMNALLTRYLLEGGFPEVVGINPSDRNRILQDYVHVVILRDIVERHGITNIVLVRQLIKTLLKNVASALSVHKCFNDLKSQGLAVSRQSLYDYLSYIEDAYLAFSVPLYSESFRKTQSNPKKWYVVDSGLALASSMGMQHNLGRLFENLIYLDLRRQGHEIYYYLTADRYEVDFFTKDREGQCHLYQVSWDVDDSATMEREMRALKAAEQELGLSGQLITPAVYLAEGLTAKPRHALKI